MAFIRRVRTASGATAVQIVEYAAGKQRISKHLGSAHTEAELGVLLERARELLEAGQGVLDLHAEHAPPVARPVTRRGDAALFETDQQEPSARRYCPGRVVATDSLVLFEALAGVYADLGCGDAVDDFPAPHRRHHVCRARPRKQARRGTHEDHPRSSPDARASIAA